MSTSPNASPELTRVASTASVLNDEFAAQVRDAIVSRRTRLDEQCPEAVDLARDVLVLMHSMIAGRAAALSGDRPAAVFQRIFRGEQYGLPLEDFARLCIEAPLAAAAGLALLVARTGHVVMPSDALPLTGVETAAQIALRSGALQAAVAHALANDGRIDADEAQQLLPLKVALQRVLARIDEIAVGKVAA